MDMSEMVGTQKTIKLVNKDVVEGIIKTYGPISRPEIARKCKLSLVTVNKIVDSLLRKEIIKTVENEQSSLGRKAQYFVYNEDFKYYIGLFYDRDCFYGVIANAIAEFVYRECFPVKGEKKNVQQVVVGAIEKLKKICENHQIDAIGIGVPGVVQDGVVSNIPIIPEWEGIDVVKELTDIFHVNVYLENDVNMVTYGMYCRDYQNQVKNMVYLYMNQGMGSGIILDGNLLKGATNFAGEVGCLSCGVSDKEPEENDCENKVQVRMAKYIQKLSELERDSAQWTETKKKLCRMIAHSILSIVCVLNPEFMVMNCSAVEEEDVGTIKEILSAQIGVENLPDMEIRTDLQELGVQGAVDLCIKETKAVYTLERK